MAAGPDHELVDVLLVEDDPGDALMVEDSLAAASSNSRFHLAEDGEQALRFLRRDRECAHAPRPGLILLDLSPPGAHGLDILAEIKGDEQLMSIPVVILSSSRHQADIQRAYALHANAYIVKPADYDGFADVIAKIGACFLRFIQPPPPARFDHPPPRSGHTHQHHND